MLRSRDLAILLATGVMASLVVQASCCGSKSNGFSGGDSGFSPTDAGHDVTVTDSAPAEAAPDEASCIVCGEGGGSSSGSVSAPIPTTCADALSRNSYIGCDYWPTVTLNPVWPQFDYAIAVSNPQTTDVTATVTGGALGSPTTVTVPAGQVKAIPLPWVDALKGPTFDQNTAVSDPGQSRIVPGGAYHLTTDLPVSVYQFSALEYEIDPATTTPDGGTCPGEGDAGAGPHCYSYSNDASLLLPSSVATGNYGILAWPSFAATPGFLTIVATADDTSVTVFPAGRVQGVPGVGPALMVRGDTYTYTLAKAGDVLEMFSDTGDIHTPIYTQDISGTIVQASHPVVAYGGHGCTFIPQNKKACDHLESSMFPVESLGTDYIVTLPHTPHGEHEWVRIMAFYDNTKIVFDPAVSGTNGAVLNVGDVLDLPDVSQAFAVHANGRIFVAHYELGEFSTLADDAGVPTPDLGDPSECPAITIAQYRSTYNFLAPSSYAENWIDVVAPTTGGTAVTVTLDGTNLSPTDFQPVGAQPFAIAHELLPPGQEGHTIASTSPFGLYVYGYGSRTSYMYPGGLDLRVQNIPPPPAQ
jgi:hypothetical protein